MDSQKYSDLRRQVLQVMNTHSVKRPNRCRRKSCPSALIPTYFTKSVLALKEGELKEIEEYSGKSPETSPSASPKASPSRTKRKYASTDRTGMIKKELDKAEHIQKEVKNCLNSTVMAN